MSIVLHTLKDAKSVDINDELQAIIQAGGEANFPDNNGVQFVATSAIESDGMRYVEVKPSQDIGHEKYLFEINDANKVVKGYAFEDNNYSLLFGG